MAEIDSSNYDRLNNAQRSFMIVHYGPTYGHEQVAVLYDEAVVEADSMNSYPEDPIRTIKISFLDKLNRFGLENHRNKNGKNLDMMSRD